MSAQFVIDVADDGSATLTIDGGQPQQFDSVEAACDAIEQANGGESEQGEMAAQGGGQEQAGFESGFAGARGGSLGG